MLRIGALTLGGVIAFLTAEVALRIFGVSYPNFVRPDPVLGYSLRPGARGLWTEEGRAYVRINGDGWRDGERVRPKPPNVYRIAVLGDSFTEALQVDLEETFCAIVEKRLADCASFSGRQVEVLNFGVSGYGTGQQLLALRNSVWSYEPDLILLAFSTGNDVSDNVRALKVSDHVPYFTLRDGTLELDDTFLTSKAYLRRSGFVGRSAARIIAFSRVAQVLNHARYLRGAAAREEARRRAAAASPSSSDPSAPEPGLTDRIYLSPPDAQFAEAWDLTEALIAQINMESRSHGAGFALVTLSNAIQVDPDSEARNAYARRLGVDDLFYPERRLSALGERLGFQTLNLAPLLQAESERRSTHFHGFGSTEGSGHWNETGHELAGERIAQWMCSSPAPVEPKARIE